MATRSGRGSPSDTPRDKTSSPSSHRASGACPDEVVTAEASQTSCIPQTRLPQTQSAGTMRPDRDRNRDLTSLALREISRKTTARARFPDYDPISHASGNDCCLRIAAVHWLTPTRVNRPFATLGLGHSTECAPSSPSSRASLSFISERTWRKAQRKICSYPLLWIASTFTGKERSAARRRTGDRARARGRLRPRFS